MHARIDSQFVHPDIAQETQGLIEQAVSAFEALVAGTCRGSEWTGFFDYPQRAGFAVNTQIKAELDSLPFAYDHVLVLGIGGSLQGSLAVHEALAHSYWQLLPANRPRLSFCGNHLSEPLTLECLDALERSEPLVTVISKSGNTIETALAFRIIKNYLTQRFGVEAGHARIVIVTDANKGTLRAFSREHGCRAFAVPDDIGGRYSVLTAVGLLPLALARYDTEALLRGADAFFNAPRTAANIAVQYAAFRNACYRHGKLIEVLACSDPKLHAFADWWRQLFGESEGKEGKGIFPSTMLLTTDLHSLGQYLQEGKRHLLETFLTVTNPAPRSGVERRLRLPPTDDGGLASHAGKFLQDINLAALQATRAAHFEGGVPNVNITVPQLDEFHLGYLFACLQTACAISAALLDVNPFDQPGVEVYKQKLRTEELASAPQQAE